MKLFVPSGRQRPPGVYPIDLSVLFTIFTLIVAQQLFHKRAFYSSSQKRRNSFCRPSCKCRLRLSDALSPEA